MKASAAAGRRRAALLTLLALLPAVPAGSEAPPPRVRLVPDRTLLLLQQEITDITRIPADAVVYGGARDLELLQQIAAATRATARAQVELLRQQNEIIRLLDRLAAPEARPKR